MSHSSVTSLLTSLQAADGGEQAARAAAPLNHPPGVATLLYRLMELGAARQTRALAARLPAAGLIRLHLGYRSGAYQFRP